MAASISDTVAAVNDVARAKGFSCVPVSWEDAQRGTVGGSLSCWGSNISDVRLWEKGGKLLYTLRSENWNERVGYVSSKAVAVMTGNAHPGGGAPLVPVTLAAYLRDAGQHAGYAGVQPQPPSTGDTHGTGEAPVGLFAPSVDDVCTIRFQTVFVPIAARETVEFCTEVYNYNTRSDADPRNLLMLCTPQGTSVQTDGAGSKKVFYHAVDLDGTVRRYWLEAERSAHKVGGAQREAAEAAAAAAARGKATAVCMGTRAMGTRFNVQMLVQVPLAQKPKAKPKPKPPAGDATLAALQAELQQVEAALSSATCSEAEALNHKADALRCKITLHQAVRAQNDSLACLQRCEAICAETEEIGCSVAKTLAKQAEQLAPCSAAPKRRALFGGAKKATGTANAARVSRGTQEDVYAGVGNTTPLRDASQHATITVTMYYTVAGGVPSADDVAAAVADLEELYSGCAADKRLALADEVTAALQPDEMAAVAANLKVQPYVAPQQQQQQQPSSSRCVVC